MNTKLKNEGYIIKLGRHCLDRIPLVDSHREAVIFVAFVQSQFQKSVQINLQKLHQLQQKPLTSSNSFFFFLSKKLVPFHLSSLTILHGPSNY